MPFEQTRSIGTDPGFILSFSTYFGRRFYTSSKNMELFMGSKRANSLWEENSRNIMSTFIESTAEITRTESRLITQPIKLGKHSFFTMQPSKKGNPKKTASSAMSSSASFSTVSSTSSSSLPSSPVIDTNIYLDTLTSEGYTEELLTVMDKHNNRYMCAAHITFYNSICGRYRTELFRLLPIDYTGVIKEMQDNNNNNTEKISFASALISPSHSVQYCQQYGFEPASVFRFQSAGGNNMSYPTNTHSHSSENLQTEPISDTLDILWEQYAQDISTTSSSSGAEKGRNTF